MFTASQESMLTLQLWEIAISPALQTGPPGMEFIMKTPFGPLALSLIITVPTVAFARTSNDSVTRAQVRSELVQLEHAGYRPSKTHYPADIQAAEARAAAQAHVASNASAAYGGTSAGTSQAGHRISKATWDSLYGHH